MTDTPESAPVTDAAIERVLRFLEQHRIVSDFDSGRRTLATRLVQEVNAATAEQSRELVELRVRLSCSADALNMAAQKLAAAGFDTEAAELLDAEHDARGQLDALTGGKSDDAE